ncbi:asparaginase domain-containing protein [Nitratifractor sp.]
MNPLPDITVFSTGGTFNKVYDPVSGKLEIDPEARALREISRRWHCAIEIRPLLHKDSLEMNDADRRELAEAIEDSPHSKILVVHGTDTMDQSAAYLAETFGLSRQIVLTGAMVPYSIDPVEATANFASGLGWLLSGGTPGVHIAMHGLILPHERIVKERKIGYFIPKPSPQSEE